MHGYMFKSALWLQGSLSPGPWCSGRSTGFEDKRKRRLGVIESYRESEKKPSAELQMQFEMCKIAKKDKK